ncbi:MAG: YihY/virulence factor BrkB family protein [Chloroflexota bacterium]|nr:MAG: YihY/virulence factor BrkB family protein [Chloroflexota bacterium]
MQKKSILNLLKQTVKDWSEDKAPRLAAALAYYTAFSLAPILVIAIAVVGLFFDRQSAQDQIITQIGGLAGQQGTELIQTMLEASQNLGSNVMATIIGVVALIFGATGVFGQLQDAMNTMWEVAPKPNRGILGFIKDRFFSFTMVVGVGFLLLVSLVISAVLAALDTWALGLFPGFETVMQIISTIVSYLVITVLFALIFKYVPDADIKWRDVWLGAAVTALLFTIGRTLIGIYLGNSNTAAQFGGAGALVVILLWVYYSAQISFFGAEFTQVYANMYGSRVVAEEDAVPLSEEAKAEQGIPPKETLEAAERQGVSVKEAARGGMPAQAIPATGPESGLQGLPQLSATRQAGVESGWKWALPPNPSDPADFSLIGLVSLVFTLVGMAGGFMMGKRGKR